MYFGDGNTNRVREISAAGAPVSLLSPSVGAQGPGQTVTVINAGIATMVQPSVSIGGANQAEFLETDTCNSNIQPGASCTVTVTFTPASSGTRTAALIISASNSQNSPQTVQLSGSEVAPVGTLSLGSTTLSFPSQPILRSSVAQALMISNRGTASLPAPAFAFGGSNAADFSLTNSCQAVITAGANCSVTVTFTPSSVGSVTATLSVTDGTASNSPQQVSLSGTGVQAVPFVFWDPSVSSLIYGTELGSGLLDATASINGSGVPGTFTYKAGINGSTAQAVTQTTVLGAGSYILTATFSPTDNTNYTSATASISFTINRASLTVTAADVLIPHGVALPSLTYVLSGFVNGDTAATATTGAASLATIATATSAVGSYTITASVGTLAAANYSFIFVPGTLTISSAPPLQFVPVTPCRIMDTRNPNGPLGGPFIAAATTRTIPIPFSACGVPANAVAYSLNITVVPRTGTLGYLSVWPAGQSQPLVSTLNSIDGSVLANAAIVPAGAGGSIDAYATNDTELIIDINGYFVPPATGSLQFYPLTPCRILDTRNPTGTFGGPSLAGGTSRSFPVPSSSCGVPAGAAAYSLNMTVVPQGLLGYLTTWPTGQTQPVVSTLNSLDGTVLANAAIVPAGTNGAVSFFAANTTDLIVDINGYFAPPATGGLNFYTATPCRIVDTRNPAGTFGGPILNGGTERTFPLSQGSCGLPATAAAYSLNMTVVPSGLLGYLTTWPTGVNQPVVSTLNAFKGQVVANAAMVPAGAGGAINVYVTNTTHVIIDTNGFFAQ